MSYTFKSLDKLNKDIETLEKRYEIKKIKLRQIKRKMDFLKDAKKMFSLVKGEKINE